MGVAYLLHPLSEEQLKPFLLLQHIKDVGHLREPAYASQQTHLVANDVAVQSEKQDQVAFCLLGKKEKQMQTHTTIDSDPWI